MKQFFLVCTICLLSGHLLAQKTNTDSLAYQLQRAKINGMLDQRREKFGQYDESLSKAHRHFWSSNQKRYSQV